MKPLKKLTISGLIIAVYVVVMYFTQWFSFGQYQIRIATSIYSLSYIYPFLILPMGVANMLSNMLMGGMGLPDMLGGLTAGIITSGLVWVIRKFSLNEWLIALPITFVPGLLVPVWLSPLINVPYQVLAVSLCIGQIIPGIIGVLLVKRLKKVLPEEQKENAG